MMAPPQTIVCLLCRDKVDFSHDENKTYLDHLNSEHHIEYYRHLTLMVNLMDKINCLDYFSNMAPASKPKTLVCLLCRKENNFSDEEGDQYFNHLRNDHMIISNLQLIKSINLMDNDGLRGIIKKFEENYDANDEEEKPSNSGDLKNDEEKMLIEDGATLDNSLETAQRDQEEMFGELEEELINGSEAMNYYKSQSVDSEGVEEASMGYQQVNNQSESFLNDSNYLNASFPNDSMNLMEDSFKSNASMNDSLGFPTAGEFDAVIKSEMSGDFNSMPSRKPSSRARGVKIEHNDFSQVVQNEIDNGNLSTTMDIPYEKTFKKMKELTGMFMKGTTCGVCDRSFNNKGHLHEHIESLHNPLPVYFCQQCQLPITNNARYRHHKKKCTG